MDIFASANPSQHRDLVEDKYPEQEENGLHHQGEPGVFKVGLVHP